MTSVSEPGLRALFDPLAPARRADPYPIYHHLRAAGRAHPTPVGLLLTRYADAAAVLRDPRMSADLRTSARGARYFYPGSDLHRSVQAGDAMQRPPSMLFLDPPDHTRLRTLVSKAFTPSTVERLRPRMVAMVDEAVARARSAGGLDLVGDLAAPLPIAIICDLFGVPEQDRAEIRAASAELVFLLDPFVRPNRLASAHQAREQVRAYLGDLVELRRREPGDDLVTGLVRTQDRGDLLSTGEVVSMCELLLIAGHENVGNLIANGMLALLDQRDQWDRLVADPGLATTAVDELLRFDSPVQFTTRSATEEVEVAGQVCQPGQDVVVLLGAANRDPDQFPDPDRIDVTRRPNRHLTFGAGIHFCLGAPLARMEAEIALTALAQRLPGLRLAGSPVRRETIAMRGLTSLPLAA